MIQWWPVTILERASHHRGHSGEKHNAGLDVSGYHSMIGALVAVLQARD